MQRDRSLSFIFDLPRYVKRAIVVSVDIFLCIVTVALAYRLRLDMWIFPFGGQWLSYGLAILFAVPIFIKFGLYRAIFRYVGWGALISLIRACAFYGVAYALVFTVVGVQYVPRSVGIMQPILLFLAVSASRASARYVLSGDYGRFNRHGNKRRVLIYGAGTSGRQLAAALSNSHEMKVVGFVDDEPRLHGSLLNGKSIYAPKKMISLIDDKNIDDVLLAIPSASRFRRNEIIANLQEHQISVRTLPNLGDLAYGRVTVNDLKPLDVEDLLGRDSVPPNTALLAKRVTGKTVLVSGAGGSIGSELCRQILQQNPVVLILLEQCEFNLYAISQELEKKLAAEESSTKLVCLLGNVQDRNRVDAILGQWRPDTIYHAAAYKHVPLVEGNMAEAAKNNVFGTYVMVEMAEAHKVEDFVLISTDKAVRPTNVMGATKRVAEMILQAMTATACKTRFSMVRFGNVLGSSGSVVPLFRKQIAVGGPLTVTHREITRYFMTIPEAAQLVIQAGGMAEGGEVFVLNMGEPVRIVDLARRMIELSGLTVKNDERSPGDIAIEITGLRPGEKLFEELLIGNDPTPTLHPEIMKAHDQYPSLDEIKIALAELASAFNRDDSDATINLLKRMVPEFDHAPLGQQ